VSRGEGEAVALHLSTYSFMTKHLLAVSDKTDLALRLVAETGTHPSSYYVPLLLPSLLPLLPPLPNSLSCSLSYPSPPSLSLFSLPVPLPSLSDGAQEPIEMLTDLTAIVTLSRGCEALQQSVDDYYRQVYMYIITLSDGAYRFKLERLTYHPILCEILYAYLIESSAASSSGILHYFVPHIFFGLFRILACKFCICCALR
jgi:hypothetical protein